MWTVPRDMKGTLSVLARVRDPHDMGAMIFMAVLLLVCEAVLCVAIVMRIPCTSSPPCSGTYRKGAVQPANPLTCVLKLPLAAASLLRDWWHCKRTG